jgi:hypothetical protein
MLCRACRRADPQIHKDGEQVDQSKHQQKETGRGAHRVHSIDPDPLTSRFDIQDQDPTALANSALFRPTSYEMEHHKGR